MAPAWAVLLPEELRECSLKTEQRIVGPTSPRLAREDPVNRAAKGTCDREDETWKAKASDQLGVSLVLGILTDALGIQTDARREVNSLERR